jgi:hypothetical protein
MQVHSFVEFVWSERQGKYLLVKNRSISWTGPVLLMKGASADQQKNADAASGISDTMMADYHKQFQNQSAILSALTKTLSPIVSAGPNQFGYTPGQVNSLNSTSIQSTGQQYKNSSQALKEQQAAQGGGTELLPSGANAQVQGQLAASASNQQSDQLLGIQNAGWAQGNTNFNNAVGQEMSAAGMYSPTNYSGQGISSNQSAGSQYSDIQKADQAASPWGAIGGLLGGAVGGWASGGFKMPGSK